MDESEFSHDVCIVGCGLMGSALARSLSDSGYRVTAWNRTFARAEALRSSGVTPNADLDAAVGGSELILACTANYSDLFSSLDSVVSWRDGQALVNVTSGVFAESEEMAVWSAERGVSYLDGSVMAYPSQVGSPDAHFLLSGSSAVWAKVQPILEALGTSHFIEGDHGLNKLLLQADRILLHRGERVRRIRIVPDRA